VQRFSRKKPTILLEADSALFRLLSGRLPELGRVSIVQRVPPGPDRWVGIGSPVGYRFDSVRQTWSRVRAALAPMPQEEPSGAAAVCEADWELGGERIRCDAPRPVAVRISTSFHPRWRAADGRPVLMLAPSLTYTTVDGAAELEFRRSGFEYAALACSALTLVAVLAAMLMHRRGQEKRFGVSESSSRSVAMVVRATHR
jgi:hypothetical protein